VVSLTVTNVGTGPVDLPFKGSAVFELLVGPVSGSVPQYAAAMDVVPAAEGKDKLAARETLDVKMYFLIPKGARILALSIERSRSIRMEAEFAGMKSAEVDGFIQAQVNKETTLAMCRSAIYPLVKAMIDMNGFDIDFKGCRGLDPLHIAVLHENLGCVEGLLRDGADPAERAWFLGYEVTPLHLAVFVQNVGAARLLIEAGQDPLMVVGKTASPLEMAIRDGQKDMVELFRMSLR
jgi:hypothetical protein